MTDIFLKDLVYDQPEIDTKLSDLDNQIVTGLATKVDKSTEGSPGGGATLDGTGKHAQVEIPYADSVEGQDPTNDVTVMHPKRVIEVVTGYAIPIVEKGAVNGVANVDGNGKIPISLIPDLGSVSSYYVGSLVDMLALQGVNQGDRCIVSGDTLPENDGEYIAKIDNPALEADWGRVPSHNSVTSVNGEVGVVTLTSLEIPEIATNASDITTLDGIVTTNTFDIATNVSNIDTNVADIAANVVRLDGIDTLNGNQGTAINDNSLAIAALESPDAIDFNDVTGNEPVWAPGQAYYANGTFNIHGEYDDVTLQLGQEQYIQVINVTGTTIPNGKPVYVTGVSASIPAIDLAQADTFSKSRVIGITTMAIADGATGLVTTIGSVGDLDTNGLVPGDILYLSSTVAGGFTSTAPDIATSLGTVLTADLTVGKLFVKVNSHIVLPTIFGEMEGGSTAGNITNVYQPITDYSSHSNLAMPTDAVTGTIHIPTTGKYRMTANISINYNNIANNKPALTLGIHDGTGVVAEVVVTVTKDSEGFALFPSKLFDAVGNTDLGLEIKCDVDLVNPVFDLMSFEIESTHIR